MRHRFTFILFIFFISTSSLWGQKRFSSIEMLEIGGISQAIQVRGTNYDNPVLVFLHGGPGFPLFSTTAQAKVTKDLEEFFSLVLWEQRGTGKSYHKSIPSESMHLEQFLNDLEDVVHYAKEKFNVEKVFLWGHSWGTNLGAIFASKNPELLHAYIATGQSVNIVENERRCYSYVKEQATIHQDKKVLKKIERIDTSDYRLKDALKIRKYLYRYGGILFGDTLERAYAGSKDLKNILKTPEYSIKDKINIILNPYYSGKQLWGDMQKINLFEQATRIKVPVFFLIGKHDIIVSGELSKAYYRNLEAPNGKYFVWFNQSAHRPHIEERERFIEIMQIISDQESFQEEFIYQKYQ